jgi:hypothetical protein
MTPVMPIGSTGEEVTGTPVVVSISIRPGVVRVPVNARCVIHARFHVDGFPIYRRRFVITTFDNSLSFNYSRRLWTLYVRLPLRIVGTKVGRGCWGCKAEKRDRQEGKTAH